MKKCIAFEASRSCASAWQPCANAADAGSMFCRRHKNALDGAVIGLFVHGFADETGVNEPRVQQRRKAQATASVTGEGRAA